MHDFPNPIEAQLPYHHMIFVEGGVFEMGSEDEKAYDWEKPVHKVRVTDFYIAKYPVTQALWKKAMNTNETPSLFTGDDRPVERVSWDDAQKFIQRLNEQTERKGYRLPTEAEWEYAARGGIYWKDDYKYSGSNQLKEVGWYSENSHGETKAVGLKMPNQLGIHDMSGNVWEWCADWYGGSDYYEECRKQGIIENPGGPESGSIRVTRGGSWIGTPRFCRVSFRGNFGPRIRDFNRGFRLVWSPSSSR